MALAIKDDQGQAGAASEGGSLKTRLWTYEDLKEATQLSIVTLRRYKARGVIEKVPGLAGVRFDPDETMRRLKTWSR